MVNYNNGKVYGIYPGGKKGDAYVGSTTRKTIKSKNGQYRKNYDRWKDGKPLNKFSVFDLFDIVLIIDKFIIGRKKCL